MFVGVPVIVASGDSTATNASLVGDGVNVNAGDSLKTIALAGADVSSAMIAAVGDASGGIYPTGVGVGYCPHRDGEAFPMQEVIRKDKAINSARVRFTVRPLRRIIPVLI